AGRLVASIGAREAHFCDSHHSGSPGGAVERAPSDGGYATEPKGTRYEQHAAWAVCTCPRSQRASDGGLRRVQAVGRATLRLHERCVQAVQRTAREHGWHLCVPAGEKVPGEREVPGAIRRRIENGREEVTPPPAAQTDLQGPVG